MSHTVHRACPLCEACCGLSLTVEDGAVTRVTGDREDPFSRGHVCPKGVAIGELHADPDRLRHPMRREGDRWVELGWEEALDLVAARLGEIRAAHGSDAIAAYLGNPTVHNLGALLYAPELLRALGTRQRYSATSVDQLPHMLVAHWMFGHQLLMPVPDVDRARFLLMLGANPAASNGSIMTAPGIGDRLEAIGARGGRVVLVDPRRTETARLVDEHLFIRPGTDALFLAALLGVVLAEDLGEPGALAAVTDGLDQVAAALHGLTPEAAAGPTGIPAARTRALARELAAARGVVYGRLGVSTQDFGVTCQWLVNLLNLAVGSLDQPGGAMFTAPAVDPLGRLKLTGRGGHGRWHTRVRGLPEVNGELPAAALAEEIRTPGEGRVRALITLAGNPVLSTPDGRALEAALGQLEFMVSIDPCLNETTRHAHVILPPLSPLERSHYDVAFNLLAVRDVARWSPPVLAPPPDSRDDWQILGGLHTRLARGLRARLAARARLALGPDRLLDLALRLGPRGPGLNPLGKGLTLAALKAAPHGLDLGALEPALPGRLRTKDRRIHAAPPALLADLDRVRALATEAADPADDSLLLIGRRHLRSNNSWMHNVPRLMKGRPRCTLLVHPADAAPRGLADGDTARVRSAVGEVEAPVEVSDTVMPGVVSLPHGWGHHRQGTRQRVAKAHAGVSLNDLTDPARVDPVGGTAVLTGTPVSVERA